MKNKYKEEISDLFDIFLQLYWDLLKGEID